MVARRDRTGGEIVLLVLATILMIVGALLGPETREAEMHLPDLGFGPVRGSGPFAASRSD